MKKYGIIAEVQALSKNLDQRPQISLNLLSGELNLLKGKAINQQLEYLQRREYGVWNDWLDVKYADTDAADIPYFKGKFATRYEDDIPKFKANNAQDLSEVKRREKQGQLKLPIKIKRETVEKHDEL